MKLGDQLPSGPFKLPVFVCSGIIKTQVERERERERSSSKNRLRTRVERNDKECWEAKIHIRKGGFKCSQRPKWSTKASIVTGHMLQVIISQPGTLMLYSLITLPAHLQREALILISCIKMHTSNSRCVFLSFHTVN